MPRPIDADALYQEMVRTIVAMMRTKRWMRSDNDNEDEILLVIQNAPTLDYAPVRHGEWVDEIEPNAVTASGMEVHVFRCSACDFTWANNVLHYFKYCPNCGALMDGKEDADENA